MGVTATACVLRWRWLLGAGLAAAVCFPAAAQTRLTLEQAAARSAPVYTPTLAGQKVVVQGVVSAPAFHFPGYRLLAFDDGRYGAVLSVPAGDTRLDAFHPGDQVEGEGTISAVAGMIAVEVERVRLTGHKPVPAPLNLPVADLLGFRYLGRLVHTSGSVVEFDETTGGPYLLISSAGRLYRIFVPRGLDESSRPFEGLKAGDDVEVSGVALQYCPRPPYNTRFELLANQTSAVMLTGRAWFIPPMALALGTASLLSIGFFIWSRERRLGHQRERLRKTFQLGEEILGASSAEAILNRTADSLPGILGVTGVQLYVQNRATKTLDAVAGDGESSSISLSAPPDGIPAGAVACFHYRTLLAIPDIGRSPFPIAARDGGRAPKSLLFAPMLAQTEVMGVLELDQDDRARDFTADEQALAQHLANQIAVALRLLDQRSVQEQLFRTEKVAAVGRLISGIVNELQTPLSSISDLAGRVLEKGCTVQDGHDLGAIAAEARKASVMVDRLVSFAAAEQGEARPVAIRELLVRLVEFREGDWRASGIRVQNLISQEPVFVLGSQGQLEQVFLNLLVHAEQTLADAAQKVITIRTTVFSRRLLVDISFSAAPQLGKAQETAAVLGVTRSVVAGHGGEVRLVEKPNAEPHFEVEFPVISKERTAPASANGGNAATPDPQHPITALVVEPDESAQRHLLTLLSARGCRVVPIGNSDTALELVHRMRFDVAFCSVHAPGLNWVELSERMQPRVGGFILLSDSYNAELASDFEGEGRYVLPRPVQEADLDRVLTVIGQRAASRTSAA